MRMLRENNINGDPWGTRQTVALTPEKQDLILDLRLSVPKSLRQSPLQEGLVKRLVSSAVILHRPVEEPRAEEPAALRRKRKAAL